jgi:uncharacterized protein YfcZ (UPF0381/DUF406 family)
VLIAPYSEEGEGEACYTIDRKAVFSKEELTASDSSISESYAAELHGQNMWEFFEKISDEVNTGVHISNDFADLMGILETTLDGCFVGDALRKGCTAALIRYANTF